MWLGRVEPVSPLEAARTKQDLFPDHLHWFLEVDQGTSSELNLDSIFQRGGKMS